MAAITGAVIAVGTAAYSANQQKKAAQGAANAAQGAADIATAEQRRQYDQSRADNMPWLQQGGWALDQQRNFLDGDWSGFEDSPDYAFAVDQGFKGLNRGAAANGSFGSGGADADRIALGQGLATQYAGNWWNKLAGMSGTGQQTGQYLGQMGANLANKVGQNAWGAADARASAYQQRADANSQLAGTVGGFASGMGNSWGSMAGGSQGLAGLQTTNSWGQLTNPRGQGWQGGQLGPSNGNAWNFGGGW